MNIYFVTSNKMKVAEVKDLLKHLHSRSPLGINVECFDQQLRETLHPKIETIVADKALEAYKTLRLPCLVEHGGLFINDLPGLPGGLGQIIWNAVGDRICSFLREGNPRVATARSILGYCDGQRVHKYIGETHGQVAMKARGDYEFLWDPIFIPDGSTQTYGEMGLEGKRATSPTVRAWEAFLKDKFKYEPQLPEES